MLIETPALDIGWHGYSWLDQIIEEQAAYYGMTVEQHAKFQNEMAQFDEDNPQL